LSFHAKFHPIAGEKFMSIRKVIVSTAAALALLAAGTLVMALSAMPAAAENAAAPARLNPNTATEAQLQGISSLTPELVALILQKRPYAAIGDFDKTLAGKLNAEQKSQLYTQLFVPVKLNSASEADIKLIPGITKKLVHEFEEYRPYKNMDQFNREIGKYVDEKEVARLRGYVTLD
jgi:DNA uptake protein ComE-like DNA-binding protein